MSQHTILERWECAAALYHRRFGRLAPGKNEPAGVGYRSSDPDNIEQYFNWVTGPQAWTDTMDRILDLEAEIKRLQDTALGQLTDGCIDE